jgi:hypothetical protein
MDDDELTANYNEMDTKVEAFQHIILLVRVLVLH